MIEHLGSQTTAVSADDGLDVTSILLGSTVISSLGWHPDNIRVEGMYGLLLLDLTLDQKVFNILYLTKFI